MTVWEIVIMMVVGTICITSGIGIVYNSIVNTVERYQIRKSKRDMELLIKVFEQIPGVFTKLIEMVTETEQKRNAEFAKKMSEHLNFKDE